MRVVIGEDEVLMRQGLALLIGGAGFEVVAVAGDRAGVVREATRHRPELVVTDIRMPPDYRDEGLRAAVRIKHELPATGVMVLSQHVQRRYMMDLLSGNPSGIGYLLKQRVMDVDTFSRDLKTVASGGVVLDPEVASLFVTRARTYTVRRLTDRQEVVLALMSRGLSNVAIAHELHIQESSVVRHVSHIYEVLGLEPTADAHRRVQAVVQHLWP